MKIGTLVVCLIAATLSTTAWAQQLAPSQLALAHMAAVADAYEAQMERFSAENVALQKQISDLKSKCGEPCKEAKRPAAQSAK